jgi:hypothetical protein
MYEMFSSKIKYPYIIFHFLIPSFDDYLIY